MSWTTSCGIRFKLGADSYLSKQGSRFRGSDATSRGRLADGVGAVAAVHIRRRNCRPPKILTRASVSLANGDDAAIMQSEFRAIWAELNDRLPDLFRDSDIDHPTAEQMLAVKREGKIRLGLDPDRPVRSRMWDDWSTKKSGRTTAFTNENLEHLVSMGVQVVLYSNVQADTQSLFDDLLRVAERLNAQGPGRLILKTGWNIPEQGMKPLLPAVDLGEGIPSTRGTEASGFSETGFSFETARLF